MSFSFHEVGDYGEWSPCLRFPQRPNIGWKIFLGFLFPLRFCIVNRSISSTDGERFESIVRGTSYITPKLAFVFSELYRRGYTAILFFRIPPSVFISVSFAQFKAVCVSHQYSSIFFSVSFLSIPLRFSLVIKLGTSIFSPKILLCQNHSNTQIVARFFPLSLTFHPDLS